MTFRDDGTRLEITVKYRDTYLLALRFLNARWPDEHSLPIEAPDAR